MAAIKLYATQAGMLDLQTQLYILSATFGGVIFLLILLVLVLALSVARIKEQLHEALRGDKGDKDHSWLLPSFLHTVFQLTDKTVAAEKARRMRMAPSMVMEMAMQTVPPWCLLSSLCT